MPAVGAGVAPATGCVRGRSAVGAGGGRGAQAAAGMLAGEAASGEDGSAGDEHVVDATCERGRVIVGGARTHSVLIDQDDVGEVTGTEAASGAEPEPLCHSGGEMLGGLWPGEEAVVAHIGREIGRERAAGARMGVGADEDPVGPPRCPGWAMRRPRSSTGRWSRTAITTLTSSAEAASRSSAASIGSVPWRAATWARVRPCVQANSGATVWAMVISSGHSGPRLGLWATCGNHSRRSCSRRVGSRSSTVASAGSMALTAGGSSVIPRIEQPRVYG